MGQYMLKKEKDWKHLQYALENYELKSLFIRACMSAGFKIKNISLKLKNEDFKFEKKKDFKIFIREEPIITFPLKQYKDGFRLEYLDKKGIRAWNENYSPLCPELLEPESSLLRNDLDDLLIEIGFKGKIRLEHEKILSLKDLNFWTLEGMNKR